MNFHDLATASRIDLYAGDMPDLPQYRLNGKVGLSLTQSNEWHIKHDATDRLPLADSSVDTYQSEDVFEHIAYSLLKRIVLDIYRVLKPHGLFRLSVPDYRCDVLALRSIRDKNGRIVFDPSGGGAYRRRYFFCGDSIVTKGGHLWFPTYEAVRELLNGTGFTTTTFLHYYNELGQPHANTIDYSKGYIQRTPDHDNRVVAPFRPMSLVVDCIK